MVDFPWSVDEVAGGRLEDDFTDLSDLTDLEDFLMSAFFFSAGPLKPEVLWPSTTPTTDTSAGSTRVGLTVSAACSLTGVDDLASLFSFFSLHEGVESWVNCSGVKALQRAQSASCFSTQGSGPCYKKVVKLKTFHNTQKLKKFPIT